MTINSATYIGYKNHEYLPYCKYLVKEVISASLTHIGDYFRNLLDRNNLTDMIL